MTTPVLSADLTRQVLRHLGLVAAPPTLSLLDALVNAYIRTVPWESAFRIVKRANTSETAEFPRWPDEFWADNLVRGGGGTCFESNYAFFSLLCTLGYDGYLTINNMGDSIGCHTAIILLVAGAKWLVDAGLPLYAPLPISSRGVLYRATAFMTYTVQPDGHNVYQIERRPHPQTNAFTLIDQPVSDTAYRAATTADYEPTGHFLDRVIINKIIRDQLWRFNSDEKPWQLNLFQNGVRTDVALTGDVATAVAGHFEMDVQVVSQAIDLSSTGGSTDG
jgi:arylamine N-acetyltransferase